MAALDADGHERAQIRMRKVDALPADIRACVHDYGLTIVDNLMRVGLTKANHIRHAVEIVRRGSVEVGNRTMTDAMRTQDRLRMVRTLEHLGYTVVQCGGLRRLGIGYLREVLKHLPLRNW